MIKIYEIAPEHLAKLKNILEAQETVAGELDVEIEKEQGKGNLEKAKAWKINEFKRNGYILREAKALGIDKRVSYLYIDSSDDFFKRNEKILIDNGAKLMHGHEFEEVKSKIQSSEETSAQGLGLLFG
jgi:hypothetical protein